MGSSEPTQEDFAAAIDEALARVVPGEISTRWVLLVETIGEDGERGMWMQSPPGAKPWDTLGLLKHAEHMELAATITDAIPAGDEDDRDD